MQNRRAFIKQASLWLAGGLVVPHLLFSCDSHAPGKRIGLQLYSLRDMVQDSGIREVLKTVARMGYTNLETASYDNGKIYGLPPAEFKKMVDDLGMTCTSAHLSQAFTREKEAEVMAWWDKAIEAHHELGVKYMVQPWMPVNEQTTLDDIKMYCDYFNTVGYKTAAASIAFGYHNHDFEFRKINGQVIFDFLLKNVSKNHVMFELDVLWCQKGGYDPATYLKNYADQIKLVHIQDEKEIGASGTMNFQSIFDQMYANNIQDWYVEVEKYTNDDPVTSVQQSFDYLMQSPFVK